MSDKKLSRRNLLRLGGPSAAGAAMGGAVFRAIGLDEARRRLAHASGEIESVLPKVRRLK
ncbi:MAG: hypothetical protein ACYC2E_03995 [Sulfuricella sp.]